MIKKFRKKPVIIEAIEFTNDNAHEIAEWIAGKPIENPFALSEGVYIKQYGIPNTEPLECIWALIIPTLEGEMEARHGDFVIKDVAGEFYPCKPEIFHATYEEVTDGR